MKAYTLDFGSDLHFMYSYAFFSYGVTYGTWMGLFQSVRLITYTVVMYVYKAWHNYFSLNQSVSQSVVSLY